MGALATSAGIAAACLVIAFLLRKNSAYPKIVPWLMLTAGLGLSGIGGVLLAKIVGILTSLTGSATQAMFGVAVPGVLALAIGLALVLHMKPKASPSKATPWLALIFPSVLASIGGAFAGIGEQFGAVVMTVAQTTTQLIAGLGG